MNLFQAKAGQGHDEDCNRNRAPSVSSQYTRASPGLRSKGFESPRIMNYGGVPQALVKPSVVRPIEKCVLLFIFLVEE